MAEHKTYFPTYDFINDPSGLVDPTVIDEVIKEAESYTAVAKPTIGQMVGGQILKALERAGRHGEVFFINLPTDYFGNSKR